MHYVYSLQSYDQDLLGRPTNNNLTFKNLTLVSNLSFTNQSVIQSKSGHPEWLIFQVLVQNGANISARTDDGWQPLHSACKWNSADCAAKLLAYGADINALSNGGKII